MRHLLLLAALLAAAGAAAGLFLANDVGSTAAREELDSPTAPVTPAEPRLPEAAPQSPSAAPASASALRVFVDPETGELVTPSAEEMARRAGPLGVSTAAGLPVGEVEFRSHPNGMHSAKLNGRFMSALVATPQADGSVEVSHALAPVETEAEAEEDAP